MSQETFSKCIHLRLANQLSRPFTDPVMQFEPAICIISRSNKRSHGSNADKKKKIKKKKRERYIYNASLSVARNTGTTEVENQALKPRQECEER